MNNTCMRATDPTSSFRDRVQKESGWLEGVNIHQSFDFCDLAVKYYLKNKSPVLSPKVKHEFAEKNLYILCFFFLHKELFVELLL